MRKMKYIIIITIVAVLAYLAGVHSTNKIMTACFGKGWLTEAFLHFARRK